MPELVSHWFTRDYPPGNSSSQVTTSAPNLLTSLDTMTSDAIEGSLVCHTNAGQPHEDSDSCRAEQTPASVEVIGSVVSTTDSEVTTNSVEVTGPVVSSCVTNHVHDLTVSSGIDEDTWCYCKRSEHYDFMIACDAKDCKIEWYHLSCVNLTMDDVPKDTEPWYCPTCMNEMY